jgi:hypothetical protein
MKSLFIILLSCLAVQAFSQRTTITDIATSGRQDILRGVSTLPPSLREASGLEHTSSCLWTHNDDGVPALYCLDSAGALIRAVQLNAMNRGWEDLTRDDEHNLYIGAFGNNKNNRKDLRIYKIPNPERITEAVTIPAIIQFNYADQKAFPPPATSLNFDVDAMAAMGPNLYLFTKNRSTPFSGYSKVYKLATTPGQQTAQLIDSIFVGKGAMLTNWVTGADFSPDKKILALLLHDRVLFIRDFKGDRFSSGTSLQLRFNHFSHKAGICFKDAHTLYIVDELEMGMIGGKLYTVDLRPFEQYLTP